MRTCCKKNYSPSLENDDVFAIGDLFGHYYVKGYQVGALVVYVGELVRSVASHATSEETMDHLCSQRTAARNHDDVQQLLLDDRLFAN